MGGDGIRDGLVCSRALCGLSRRGILVERVSSGKSGVVLYFFKK